MTEFDGLPTLRDPIAVAAFAGWNDAGEAATGVIQHLSKQWGATPVAAIDPEDYYDFQVHRPTIALGNDGHTRSLTWPTTRLETAAPPGSPRDVVLVHGVEPNMRWRTFAEELLETFEALEVSTVVLLGALLSDTAHTRQVPITGNASQPELMEVYNLTSTGYEGPTGIVGVLQEACARAEIPAISLWAQVPHYVSQPPSPKATLALLHRLEDTLDVRIGLGDLAEQAADWQSAVDEAASSDAEMAEYVHSLEEREGDDAATPSGEELAKLFEKYLRRPGGPTD